MRNRKYPKGSSVAVGLMMGVVLGVLMEDIARFVFLGLMFGLIGEYANKEKK
jgi:hypothetical protein